MDKQRIWASVSGVCIATAIVAGSVLVATSHDSPAKPAGQPVAPASTVTATITASPIPAATTSVARSVVKKKAAPVKRRHAVVQRQEAPVTDPSTDPTTNPAPPPVDDPAPSQSSDDAQDRPPAGDDGIVRKPRPSQGPVPPTQGPRPKD